jgi:hypothetical protein
MVCLAWYTIDKLHRREQIVEGEALAATLIAFSLLVSVTLTYGFLAYGIDWATISRYTSWTMFGIMGAYMLIARRQFATAQVGADQAQSSFLHDAALAMLVIGLVATDLYGNFAARNWSRVRTYERYIIQTIDRQSDQNLATIFHLPAEMRSYAPFLQQNKLNAFSEPPSILAPITTTVSITSNEILPGQPVIQELACPVQTLYDVSVLVMTQGRINTSSITLSVSQAGAALVAKTFPASQKATGPYWITALLDKPVMNCLNTRLTVSVQSADAVPGNAVAAVFYPRYYNGTVTQAYRAPAGSGDFLLGLLLNADHYNQAR